MTQVTYDLNELDASLLLPLRDTLIAALQTYASGPRRIIVQLCLALSCFALQVQQWDKPVQDMIERFGKDPATVPVLLEFLKVLPEEIMDSHRVPITVRRWIQRSPTSSTHALYQNDFYKERSAQLLTANATPVLELLTMYIQAEGMPIVSPPIVRAPTIAR